jgi:hypothetical protein
MMNATRVLLIFGVLATLFWLLSAACWIGSANIEIPNDQDAFIRELRHAAVWNAWAARFAAAAAICTLVMAVCEILRNRERL